MDHSFFNRIPARAYLLLAILIFATSSPVTSKLMALGSEHLIHGRNPISICNLFFVGNLCALICLALIHGRDIKWVSLKRISGINWLSMFIVSIVGGVLAPAFFFSALASTPVNNVILIGRIEPPLILALSVLFLQERVNGWVLLGAILAFLGVAMTVVLPTLSSGQAIQVGSGDGLTVAGAASAAIATVISKARLQQIPLGIFNLFRMSVGTLVFCGAVIQLFGLEHFTDIGSPFLWQWMLIYSAVIVVGGQLAWFFGLRTATAADISLVSSFGPIAGVLATYFILGNVPTWSQYCGGAVILLGIVVSQWGVNHTLHSPPASGVALDEVGYKGV